MEALYADGSGIRNSSRVVETFVPGTALAAMCDEGGCSSATGYSSQPTVASVQHLEAANPTSTGEVAKATESSSSSGAVVGKALGKRSVKGVAALGLAGLVI